MNKYKSLIVVSLLTSLVTLSGFFFVIKFAGGNSNTKSELFIPKTCWPEFDRQAPHIINGPLWVGYDEASKQWRYLKIETSKNPSEPQRGLIDPGSPENWTDDLGTTGFFNSALSELPSGTHLNNKYNPNTPAAKYQQDDIMIKVGNFWVDKYESSLVIIGDNEIKFIDDPKYGGIDSLNKSATGTAFDFSLNAIAVSQRRVGTSGLTYFAAEQAAVNNGKHLIRNEQWQAAASGTKRSDATGMVAGGEAWTTVADMDISRFGVVGCAGSLWEWTSSWGQYGAHYTGAPTNWYDWPGPASYAEWDGEFDTYGDDIIINVAGRSYTKQDSARYASGLPAALVRGGSWGDHNRAGIFAMIADGAPSYYGYEVGFRCVK